MILKKPTTDNQEILYALINHGSLTSIELKKKHTGSSYPPARVAELNKIGLSIQSFPEKYKNRRGEVSHVARYMLMTPKREAIKIYQKLCA